MNPYFIKLPEFRWLALGSLFSLIACGGGGSSVSTTLSRASNYYGSGINADDLANIVIGWDTTTDTCNRTVSYRCRAKYSGNMVSIHPKFIWSDIKNGYGLGNGGNILVQVQSDDGTSNHFPSGVVLASLEYDQPITVGNYFPLLTFSNPASLTSGQLYHIVFSNVSADPTANYISLDHLYMWKSNSTVQPNIANTDLAILERGCNGVWSVYNRGIGQSLTPVIELDFESGDSQGQGYIHGYGQTTTSPWMNPKPISENQGVRETFTVSGSNRTVSSVSVRVNRLSGSSPLAVSVETFDGTLIGQGTVAVPQGLVDSTSGNESWVTVSFGRPLTLQAGVGYHLVLSSPSGTIHTTHVLEKGNENGYRSTTYFSDGYAEFNSGTGWVGWDLFAVPNRTDCDLQFYFE
jgi:hypothetical protein